MWWWKSVKLMIGMCSMQHCLPLIAHQCRRSWEDAWGYCQDVHDDDEWWWNIMREKKIQESFYWFSKMSLDIASCWTWWTSYFEAWHKESGLIFSQGPKPLSLAWEDEEKAEKDISFKTSFYLSRRVRKGRVDEKGVFYLCLLLSGGGQTLKRLFVKYSFLAFSSLTVTHTLCAFVILHRLWDICNYPSCLSQHS